MINCTDLWRAANCPLNKRPCDWAKRQDVQQALPGVMRSLFSEESADNLLMQKTRGRFGGTWMHPLASLGYAQFLGEKFTRLLVGEMLREGLVTEKLLPKRLQRPQALLQGPDSLKTLKQVAAKHGITLDCPVPATAFPALVNAIYMPLIGSASSMREKNQLPASASVRQALNPMQRTTIEMAERLTAQAIVEENVQGFQKILEVASREAKKVAALLR